MTSKTNFINYFLLAFTLAFISSGLSAGTLDFKDKKKDKEKKEELTADGPYVLYQPDGQIRVINVDKKGNIIDTTYHITSKLYPACDRPQRQVSI